MWLTTRYGYFNVVENTNTRGELIVKARVEDHLIRLRRIIPELGETKFHEDFDYPYRALISKAAFAIGFADVIMDIDYKKTKPAMSSLGKKFGNAIMSVWSTMIGIEEDPGRINKYYYKGSQGNIPSDAYMDYMDYLDVFPTRESQRSIRNYSRDTSGPDYSFAPWNDPQSGSYDGQYELNEPSGKRKRNKKRKSS